jgi:hypothetical protein
LSIQLAQLARDPFLETLYTELLNAGGIEVGLRSVKHYAKLGDPVSMADVTRSALRFNEVVLGYRTRDAGVVINPNKDDFVVFDERDRLIVLAQQIYA